MISREEAAQIAGIPVGDAATSVYLEHELPFRAPVIYMSTDLAECWLAYPRQGPRLGIGPSTIVVIHKETGAVLYRGSAHDEG